MAGWRGRGGGRQAAGGHRWLAWIAAAAALIAWLAGTEAQGGAPVPERAVVVLQVEGAIGPATAEYLRQGLKDAAAADAALVVLKMDTPGGLESATQGIVRDILAAPVPVATWVAPAGARAASAGTYILYASPLAAMAPGTHLGAATPVIVGAAPSPAPAGAEKAGGEKAAADPMTAKSVNDAAAWIASLAALNGRDPAFAERAVREAATLTAEQAKAQKVVEVLAADLPALIAAADGRIVQLRGRPHVLALQGRPVAVLDPGWRTRILAAITHPEIAYILLLVGMYGLIFEAMSPGMVAPGVVGAIALVVGLFALNMLPVNYAGLALLVIGVGLMIAEAHTPSIGALGLGGVAAFGIGSLLLFPGPLPEYRLSPGVVAVAAGLSLVYFVAVLGAALRSRRRPVVAGELVGARSEVLAWSGGEGLVQLQGETWRARGPPALAPGAAARVIGRNGLTLTVEPDP